MAQQTRIYAVTSGAGSVQLVRLVRASHPNTAITHVARQHYAARVASQDDIVTAMADGAKVETAKQEQLPLID